MCWQFEIINVGQLFENPILWLIFSFAINNIPKFLLMSKKVSKFNIIHLFLTYFQICLIRKIIFQNIFQDPTSLSEKYVSRSKDLFSDLTFGE